VRTARKVAHRLGRAEIPIVLGCGAGCTRDVIDQTVEAKAAGADAALVLVPSFFHFALVSTAIVAFFEEVADSSAIPIIIYNYPGVVAGLDVNSEMLEILGRHKNIVGVKLTCGGIAKVSRVAAVFDSSTFCALAGQSDWLVPALSVGGTGCITGLANLFPRVSTVNALYPFRCHPYSYTFIRPASSCTTSTSRGTSKRHKHYRSSWLLRNGDLANRESTVQNGWSPRSSVTPKPVQTVAVHIQYMERTRKKSGY
jgi:hypothetical protein